MSPVTCIPWAGGVPAAGGHPIWWDNVSGPVPAFNKRIDDPRWQGSMARTYPESGVGVGAEHAIFRALYDNEGGTNYLYLSWWIQADPKLVGLTDQITIGFQNAGGATHVLRLPAYANVPAGASGPNPAPAAKAYNASAGATPADPWSIVALVDAPDWIGTFARSWTDLPNKSWALHVRVPMSSGAGTTMDDTGIALGTTFRMWYEVKVDMPPAVPGDPDQLVFHSWPRALTPRSTFNTVPKPSDWGDFKLGGGPEDAACASGVWIDSAHIGTKAGAGIGNTIGWSRDPANIVNNEFVARPKNDSGAAIPAGAAGIHARFRLAKWGSQPDWNDVPNPDTLWTDIKPGGGDVTGATIPVGAFGDLSFTWRMTDATDPSLDDFDPLGGGTPALRAHNCMLVELSGAGIDFGRSSVYTNMNAVEASEFVREAEISVVGLGALGGRSHRDVFLFVQALNLPADVDPRTDPTPTRPKDSPRALSVATSETAIAARQDPPTAWEIAQSAPTHMVHVYHDTGERHHEAGRDHPILRVQTSFGVFVTHDGPLFGWDHTLEGDLVEITPNFFRLSVPKDGVATVTQRIVALEQPRPKPPEPPDPPAPTGCLGMLFAPFGHIVAFIRRLLGK